MYNIASLLKMDGAYQTLFCFSLLILPLFLANLFFLEFTEAVPSSRVDAVSSSDPCTSDSLVQIKNGTNGSDRHIDLKYEKTHMYCNTLCRRHFYQQCKVVLTVSWGNRCTTMPQIPKK